MAGEFGISTCECTTGHTLNNFEQCISVSELSLEDCQSYSILYSGLGSPFSGNFGTGWPPGCFVTTQDHNNLKQTGELHFNTNPNGGPQSDSARVCSQTVELQI